MPPVRVSDAERDQVLRALRDAAVEGRLSNDSFARRLDLALRSPSRDELADGSVSRSHARLNAGPDGWVLTDLGSTNGTRVNGWIVNRPQVVRPGDVVTFGQQTVVVTR